MIEFIVVGTYLLVGIGYAVGIDDSFREKNGKRLNEIFAAAMMGLIWPVFVGMSIAYRDVEEDEE